MKATPLSRVKEQFKDKASLVKAIRDFGSDLWSDREGPKGLERVTNAKLLHLHSVLSEVKSEFGTRSGLIDAIVKMEKREKDSDYRNRFEAWGVPRLLDYLKGARRRTAS